jgi:hypothetical protein
VQYKQMILMIIRLTMQFCLLKRVVEKSSISMHYMSE